MKVFVEIAALVIAFLLFRKVLQLFFPSSPLRIEVHQETKRALRRFYRRYLMIFFGLGLLASGLAFLLFDQMLSLLHQEEQALFVYPIHRTALILPAIISGFTVANILGDKINAYIQKDGLAFFLKEVQANWEGLNLIRLKFWHYLLVLAFLVLLLYSQFSVFFKAYPEVIIYTTQVLDTQSISKDEVSKVGGGQPLVLYFQNGDSLSMGKFDYSKEEVKAYFKP